MGFLSKENLQKMGFKSLGENVKISDKASIYNCQNISIGNNTRIDDFCILSAGTEGIHLGQYIHIACYCSLIGKEKIIMEDFSGLSSRCAVYSSSDDYSGEFMTNPMVDEKYTNVQHAPVILEKHVLVGANSVILPGVKMGIGSAVGALSLVMKDVDPFSIYMGIPARKIKDRKQNLLDLEKEFIRSCH